MITAIYIGVDRLDLFEDESIVIDSSVSKIEDITKVFTDISNTFSVPATPNNNRILKHFYNQNIVDGLDLRKSMLSVIELDGVFYKKVKIKPVKVELESQKPISYSLEFFGNLISLKETLKDDKLSDLDLSAYNFTFNSGNAFIKLQEIGDVSASLFSKARQYFYDSSMSLLSNETQTNLYYNNNDDLSGVDWTELNYSIKDIRIIEAIEADYNLTFSRDFLGTNDFLNSFTLLSAPRKKIQSQVILTNNLDSDPVTSGNTMLATGFGTETERITRVINFEVTPSASDVTKPYSIYIKNGNDVVAQYANVTGLQRLILEDADFNGVLENVTFWIEALEPIVYSAYITREVYINLFEYRYTTGNLSVSGTYNIADNMPNQKIIDYLKGIFQQYRLIAIAQDDDSIYIDTLNNFYKKGKIVDYTNYVDFSKITVSKGKLLNRINFQFSEPQTLLAEQFQNDNEVSYGDLELEILDENGSLIDGESLDFKLPFEQVVYERLTDYANTNTIEVQYGLLTDEDFKPQKIKQHRHYLQNKTLTNPIKVIDLNSTGQPVNSLNIPIHTNTLTNPIFSNTFGEEFNEYNGNLITNTLYSNYHKDFITEVFNKNRRMYSFSCKDVPLDIIINTQLNDVIEVKDKYYRIDTIKTDILNKEISLNTYNIINLDLNVTELITVDGTDTTSDDTDITIDQEDKPEIPSEPTSDAFIISIETTTAGETFTIPTTSSGTYDYNVTTNDGQTFTNQTGDLTITFPFNGIYDISINGVFPRIFFNNTGDKDKIIDIKNWGSISWQSMRFSFFGCSNLTGTFTDAPDLSILTDISYMFAGATSFNQPLNSWSVSNVNNMFALFGSASTFNQPLNDWDVSNVTNMQSMFFSSVKFNQDISGWDVSNVLTMTTMFSNATDFNQDISTWNVGNVTIMSQMFLNADSFDQNINTWNVGSVTNMFAMFNNADNFNQNLSSWDVKNVTNMLSIFANSGMSTENYTQTIVGWANRAFTQGDFQSGADMQGQSGMTFDTSRSGGANFADAGAARTYLTSTLNWTISGDTII